MKDLNGFKEKMLNAENNDIRVVKLWDNEYMNRPKILNKSTPEEITQALYESATENRLNKSLTQALRYDVKISVNYRPARWCERTAPSYSYIELFVVWDEENAEEKQIRQDKILSHYEQAPARENHVHIDQIEVDEKSSESSTEHIEIQLQTKKTKKKKERV